MNIKGSDPSLITGSGITNGGLSRATAASSGDYSGLSKPPVQPSALSASINLNADSFDTSASTTTPLVDLSGGTSGSTGSTGI